jgi:PEP-CTERM motif
MKRPSKFNWRMQDKAGAVVALGILASAAPAGASNVIVPLDISNQIVTWVGEGANASGDRQISATLGACSAAGGGNSTCNITGNFAFGGGGNYDFQVTGPSPFQGTETSPGSNFFNLNFSNTTYEFTLNFNNGLPPKTYEDINGPGAPPHQFSNFTYSFVSPDTTCTGVGSCDGTLVGDTPGSTLSGPVTFTLTVPSVPVPAPKVAINPTGAADQYSYQYNDLTGAGDVFIPIIDPSALVVSSLPSNVAIITDLATIEADWPGAGNFIPANEPVFDLPAELLEVPENGAFSLDFSFLDTALPVDGPILADGTLISDPLVPGATTIPEPTTWVMMMIGFGALSYAGWRSRDHAARQAQG